MELTVKVFYTKQVCAILKEFNVLARSYHFFFHWILPRSLKDLLCCDILISTSHWKYFFGKRIFCCLYTEKQHVRIYFLCDISIWKWNLFAKIPRRSLLPLFPVNIDTSIYIHHHFFIVPVSEVQNYSGLYFLFCLTWFVSDKKPFCLINSFANSLFIPVFPHLKPRWNTNRGGVHHFWCLCSFCLSPRNVRQCAVINSDR